MLIAVDCNNTPCSTANAELLRCGVSAQHCKQSMWSHTSDLHQLFNLQGSVKIDFALTVPGLVILSVSNVTQSVAADSISGPGSLQVGNGRIPVFTGGPNDIGELTLRGCSGAAVRPSSQYLIQYWIRDKFATMDTVVQAALVTTGP